MFFKKGNIICKVDQDLDESDDNYIERGYFITSQNPKNDEEYNNALLYSRIYINVYYKKCIYEDKIMRTLEKMLKNYF